MAGIMSCHTDEPAVTVAVNNCQHLDVKVKKKYLILHGWKKCAKCMKRWCGAICKDCRKPIHQQCAREYYDELITDMEELKDVSEEPNETSRNGSDTNPQTYCSLHEPLSYEVKEIIEDTLYAYVNNCYDEIERIINLSHFNTNENRLRRLFDVLGIRHCNPMISLNQPETICMVLRIIHGYVGNDLNVLCLANNNIDSCLSLVQIIEFFPHLKILDLSNNNLTHLTSLECLSGLAIEYLHLDGNPLIGTNERRPFLIELKKIFPKILYLDNVELRHLEKQHASSPKDCHDVNEQNDIEMTDELNESNLNGSDFYNSSNPKPHSSSYEPLSYEVTEIIENALYEYANNYYDEIERIINLSYFEANERIRHCNPTVSLNHPETLRMVLRIIHVFVGNDLNALILANNSIDSGDGLFQIIEFFPRLKILDLSNNNMTDLTTLRCLSGLAIEYLYLDGNPLIGTNERRQFTKELKKIFPKILYLDNVELGLLEKQHVPHPEECHDVYEQNDVSDELNETSRNGSNFNNSSNPQPRCSSYEPLSYEVTELIEDALYAYVNNYYDEFERIINLSYFDANEKIRHCDSTVSLNHPETLRMVLRIVHGYVGNDLNVLILANNSIDSGDGLFQIIEFFPRLKILDLSNNNMTDLTILECLHGLEIEYLFLGGNPLVGTNERRPFTIELRQIFPKLRYLDNVELGQMEKQHVPPSKDCHDVYEQKYMSGELNETNRLSSHPQPHCSYVPLSSGVIKIIENALYEFMMNNYDKNKKLINLSNFSSNEYFRLCNEMVSLNQPETLYTALRVIYDFIGNDLYGLCLANNMIDSGDGLVCIIEFFPDLKILDLSNNNFTNLSTLESLSGFTIEYLYLGGNPVDATCERTPFTLKVQQMFPMLVHLDNVELKPSEELSLRMNVWMTAPPTHDCRAISSKKRKIDEIYYSVEDFTIN